MEYRIPETEDEVLNILPEIDAVSGELRDVVLELYLDHAPDYFWAVRASKNHHPPDHRGQCGLVIHTCRSFCAWLRIERMLKELSLVDSFEANCGRAAILVHDVFKYGKEEWMNDEVFYHQYADDEFRETLVGVPEYTDREHGKVAADYIDEHFDVPSEVVRCVRTHNGGFGDDPNPETPLELGHHIADAMGSDQRCQYRVYDPANILVEWLQTPPPIIGSEENVDPLDEL